jgi:hypothetical protein
MREVCGFLICALLTAPSLAATVREVMQSKYMQYSFCMERQLGREWWKRHDMTLGLNHWGV